MKSARTTTRLMAGIVTLGLALGLVACGTDSGNNAASGSDAAGDQTSADPAQTDTAAAPADGEVTEIQWWAYGPVQPVAEQYIAAFEAENPDVHVIFKLIDMDTYDSLLRPALASDAGPDLYTEDPGARFEQFYQFGIDLTDAFAGYLGADWQSKISPLSLQGFTKDDKLWAAPIGGDFAGTLWINQDLFDQAGLQPPTTFDEWKTVCDQFAAQDIKCFVQGAQLTAFDQDTFQAIANTIEPGLYSKAVFGQARWTEPNLVLAFERWKWMFDEGIMQPGALGMAQYPEGNNAFLSGEYAMVMMGTWYMQNTRRDIMTPGVEAAGKADGQPFTIIPIQFPAAVAGGTPGYLFGDSGGGLAVSARSKHQEAAARFAVFMGANPAGQDIVASMMTNTPSLVDLVPDYASFDLVNPEVQVPKLEWMLEMAGAATESRHIADPDLANALGEAMTMVAAGEASPADAAAKLQADAEELGVVFP